MKHIQKLLISYLPFIISFVLILLFYAFIQANLYKRIGAFGCFDDCHTITSAYFINRGRTLYSEIFYNHQLLMPFLSSIIQKVSSVHSLYSLIAVHRLAIYAISLVLNIILLIRFRWKAIGFILLYEPIKFYIFGDRFLPEAFIPYAAAFLIGLIGEKYTQKMLSKIDYISAVFFTWLIIFLREPYIPLAIVLFAVILFEKNIRLIPWKYFALLLGISSITLFAVPIKDFIEIVFVQNIMTTGIQEVQSNTSGGTGFLYMIFYPIIILLNAPNTILGSVQFALSILFIITSGMLIFRYKKISLVVTFWVILAVSALRVEPPGKMFYEAFHMLPWHGIFIMAIIVMTSHLLQKEKKRMVKYSLLISIFLICLYSLISPQSFIRENVNTLSEFNDGYARYETYAQIINTLSEPEDKLYLELWDDIIYQQTNLDSSFPYGLYTPWTQPVEKYVNARTTMFTDYPPDIYYCSEVITYTEEELLPQFVQKDYVRLLKNNEPICVYIHKNKMGEINRETWDMLKSISITHEEYSL
jgi:hypothetical protein